VRLGIYSLLIALGLCACSPAPPPAQTEAAFKPVPPLAKSGELVVLIRNGATSFHVDAEGKYAGLEYDLVNRFAAEQGVKVKYIVSPRIAEVAERLRRGEAHMAVGVVPKPDRSLGFGPPYQQLQPVLVYHADTPEPASLKDINSGILMVESLFAPAFQAAVAKHPTVDWNIAEYQDSEGLIEKVSSRLIDYAVVESYGADAAQNYFPDVSTAFDIGKPQPIAWAWPSDTPLAFTQKVKEFFQRVQKDGTLKRLTDRYFGHVNRLQSVDATEFLARRASILTKYRKHFMEGEEKFGTDWRLLAALAYQESHWEPLATSPYGVRGIMMLTTNTADMLGVSDRLNPKQSIVGGAKYLAMMKALLPAQIAEPDRTWIALAAYNIGVAHLSDARTLASRMKKNPDSWTDLKSVIPLLRNYEYFSTLKYGFARGGETVIFVENLRSYYDILVRFEQPIRTLFPPFQEDITVANPENVRLGIDAAAKMAP